MCTANIGLVSYKSSTHNPFEKFLRRIHNEDTEKSYSYHLEQFLKFCKFTKYEQLLEISDEKKEEAVQDYIEHLIQDKKLSYGTVNGSTAAIKLFYRANRVRLDFWEDLKDIKGKNRKVISDRIYTHEELKKLIEFADLREKVAITTMLSSGMRVGALAGLRIGDIKPVKEGDYKYEGYRFEPYSEDSHERYVTFCTPECATYINLYLEDRKKDGEIITPESPFITHKINSPFINKNKGFMGSRTIRKLLDRQRYDAKIIQPITMNIVKKKSREQPKKRQSQFLRKEVMSTHGFRKYFDTKCIENYVYPAIKEVLMGHKTKLGLDTSYYRPGDEKQLLQEYLKVVDASTINDENRLRLKTEKLERENEELKELNQEVERLKSQLVKMERHNKSQRALSKKMQKDTWNAVQGIVKMKVHEIKKKDEIIDKLKTKDKKITKVIKRKS